MTTELENRLADVKRELIRLQNASNTCGNDGSLQALLDEQHDLRRAIELLRTQKLDARA